jgi:hypothetical protein
MKHRLKLSRALRAAGVLLLVVSPASAQRVSSDILGTVTDVSGRVIVGAKITVTRTETGEERGVKTNEDGNYRISGLSPGTYEIRGEYPGFKTLVRKDIEFLVSQDVVVDLTLQVGELREKVEVSGQPSLLESASSELSGVVTDKTLRELPLNGRDLFQLTLLQTGVLPTTNAGPNPFAEGGTSKAAVQGARPTMNNITLDGGDINDPAYNTPPGGVAGVQLGVDGIEEYRVLLNSYSAEFGRNAGANVQYVTKSGTNEIHGSLFEFLRNAALDARNFFDLGRVPPFIRNQFGGTVGGPLQRDRTFFFLNYESLRESKSITNSLSVPDANARQGLLPSASDPSKLVFVGVDPRISPFLKLYPLPNAGSLGAGLGLLQMSQTQPTQEQYGLVRIDHKVTANDQIFLRYVIDDSNSVVPFASTVVPGFPGERVARNQYLMLNWQRVIGTSLLNEAKLDYSRVHLAARDSNSPLSISLSPNRPLGAISIVGLPQLGNSLISPIESISNTFEGIDNLSYQRGNHTLKVGADFKRLQMNGPFDALVNGSYIFSDLTAFGFPALSDNPPLEFFLHGIPFLYFGVDRAFADSDRGFRQNYLGLYFQDDWRVRSGFTVNLGLRWEYWGNPGEASGRLANIRNPLRDPAPTVGKIWAGVPLDLWSPRLGFAWKPSAAGKTVIRGGAGIMRDQIWANLYSDTRFYEPFFRALQYVFPNFVAPPPNVNSLIGLGGPPSVIGIFGITFHPDFPYYLQYNLNVERELASDWRLQVAYVGSRGNHLPRTGEVNPFVPSLGRRINPNFGSIPLLVTDAQSFYNSGQLSLYKRFSHGLLLQASYTYSKSIDDQSGALPSDYDSDSGVGQDFFNRKGDRALSSFDRRHVFVLNYLYNLPFAAGRQGFAHTLAGGWSVGGIVSLMSGLRFTPNLGAFNNSGTMALQPADRPDLKAGVNPCGAPILGRPNQWFDPTIFTLPPPGRFGNAGRNILCGPSLKNVDFSVLKETGLSERVRLQFRAEIFNLFNHPNFDVPVNTQGPTGSGGNGDAIFVGRAGSCNPASDALGCGILAPNVGRIFRTVTTSRQIQFALKLMF